MIKVDLKSLLNHLNTYCTNCLEGAAGLCVSRTHYEVTVEHFWAKLLEAPQADLALILRQFDLDAGALEREVEKTIESYDTGNAARPVLSPLLIEWIQEAWLISSIDLGQAHIRSGALLTAFINHSSRLAAGRYRDLLDSLNRDGVLAQFRRIAPNSLEQPKHTPKEGDPTHPPAESTALGRFCIDLTAQASAGEIDPVFGRDREIRQMIDILARRRKNNPIVVGEAGVGKTAMAEGLALRIVENDVPELLKEVSLLGLDIGQLQAGAGMKGEFEQRLNAVIDEIKASPKPIILFIDEAHTLIGSGAAAGASDAANLLKPALARGELRTVAATTWSDYKKYFERDAALARRFQVVKLDEPSVQTTVMILRGLKEKYEQTHHVVVRDDAVEEAAELSSRYISGRQLPDKAVDLLDTSAARVKVLLTAKPDVIEDKERRLAARESEKAALIRDGLHGLSIDENRLQEIENRLEALRRVHSELSTRWQQEQALAEELIGHRLELQTLAAGKDLPNEEHPQDGGLPQPTEGETGIEPETEPIAAALKAQIVQTTWQLETLQGNDPLVRVEVDPDVVAKVVADWTGIPLGKVMREDAQNVINLAADLNRRIKGQDAALAAISEGIKAAKAGLKDPVQPLGIFLLVGPSGVGKTETGLAVADLLFGGERFMTAINMSEFQEKHTVSRLLGSPPGYVGYGEGGILTEAVRQRPYSVVLLDEVEKANLEVMNLFYQVFDKGVLSDGEGREIDFKNTVIFLTSNLATDAITELCAGEEAPDPEMVASAIRPILSHHFKPALLARMTIVPYLTLAPEVLHEIVCLKLDKLAARLAETHKMKLVYTPEVVKRIGARCREVEAGARNIDYIINDAILPRMSREILSHLGQGALPCEVYLDLGADGVFNIEFGG